ncbi:hypothetical protein QBC43DRAFT_335343 [Cladorrhinum sp. PSN259]|nr:hypothetical protein QBC43DRAFT_335343 [Cladorrhinum sp. PSN259]
MSKSSKHRLHRPFFGPDLEKGRSAKRTAPESTTPGQTGIRARPGLTKDPALIKLSCPRFLREDFGTSRVVIVLMSVLFLLLTRFPSRRILPCGSSPLRPFSSRSPSPPAASSTSASTLLGCRSPRRRAGRACHVPLDGAFVDDSGSSSSDEETDNGENPDVNVEGSLYEDNFTFIPDQPPEFEGGINQENVDNFRRCMTAMVNYLRKYSNDVEQEDGFFYFAVKLSIQSLWFQKTSLDDTVFQAIPSTIPGWKEDGSSARCRR